MAAKKAPARKPAKKTAAKKAAGAKPAKTPNPNLTSDAALFALPPEYAAAPDMPVAVAQREAASLARLARAQQARFAKIGIRKEKIELLASYAKRLGALQVAWTKARGGIKLSAPQKQLRDEAEKLDGKLLAGGRWACRKDQDAQAELSRIAEGSGLVDTIQDLRDLVVFWNDHADCLGNTDITPKDLDRATELADALDEVAAKEVSDIDAGRALELRNRCFWAMDELAGEIREGGRYAFAAQPKIAAKFVSRYRAAVNRRAHRKAQAKKAAAKQAAAQKDAAKKTDGKAADAKAADAKPADAKPAAPKPADTTPAANP